MSGQRLSTSRRHFLALCGASLGFGATGGYVVGADPFADDRPACDPHDRTRDPDDWLSPRYDPRGTGRAPVQNAPRNGLREQWHAEFRVNRIGQPAVTAGRVAISLSDGDQVRIVTIDLASGEELWAKIVSDPAVIGVLVASDGDLFYQTHTDDVGLGVMALSLRDGDRRWFAPEDHSPRSQPVVTEDGRVWITERRSDDEESSIITLSADTGIECSNWRVSGAGGGPVVLDENRLYFGTSSGAVALDRQSGEEQWRTDEVRNPQVVTDDWMYATNTFGWLSAHDSNSGASEWTVESEHYADGELDPDNPEGMIDEEGRSFARPDYRDLALADDVLLTRERVFSDHADRITAFNSATGDQLWQLAPADERPDSDDEGWYTGPSLAGKSAFVCQNHRDDNSYLRRIDISTGDIIDSVEMDATAVNPPAVSRGAVVVPRTDGVVCYADDRWR